MSGFGPTLAATADPGRDRARGALVGLAAAFLCRALIQAIANGQYKTLKAEQIRGSGYVVECLQAAMWCFLRTATFEQAVLAAANLGDVADTTAAVCGQIAGAHYGMSAIPTRWRAKLAMGAEIIALADGLYDLGETVG